ncbi:hypothetical protein [Vibrio sp. Hep-1b-8]|uniref:hypothetical protein n=1 Tax=Vibrio sp. Hep-1b-8 TaxID=2144187 RepID=UPI0011109D93|nr:hypothetical protein [Vibrio sp. Hep-1b-8]TMX41434.1 hypothetical protein DA100_08010 [Vibrio sp. Hep-1b-8]
MAKTYEQEQHALTPYSFRVYNKDLEGRREERYSVLNKISGKFDLLEMLETFMKANSDKYRIFEESQQVYCFSDIKYDAAKREVWGWFNVGYYGIKTDIINIKTQEVDFEKAKDNAEIIKHYVHFRIPKKANEGMAFLHTYRGNGVKTLFFRLFSELFKAQTTLNLQMNPLAYDKAIHAWLDAPAKEVKLTKFVGVADVTDKLKKLGHHEQELVVKPPRKGTLGRLRDYLINKKSEHYQAVEVLSEFGSQVKTVVEMNGKKRTFNVGHSKSSSMCEIELDEAVVMDEGVPNFKSMNRWVREISDEYAKTMY